MEEFGGPWFEGIGSTISRKKRSHTFRRPRPESVQFPETRDPSPSSSTPPYDDLSKLSSDEITGDDTNSRRKVFNLNQCALRGTAGRVGEYPNKKIKGDRSSSLSNGDGDLGGEAIFLPHSKTTSKTKGSLELHSTTEGINGGRNGESQSSGNPRVNGQGVGNDKVKKVKLKVGGVTRTIQTNVNTHGASSGGASAKSSRTSDAPRSQRKIILQDNSDNDHTLPNNKSGMRGVPWKDFTRGSSATREKEDSSMGKNASGNQGENSEQIRKSKRVPKRRVLDGAFDEEDGDDEIRYLEKLKFSKVAAVSKGFEEHSRKKQRISKVSENTKRDAVSDDFVLARSSIDDNKSRSERGSEDTDYEEEEVASDGGGPDGKKKKKPRNNSIDSPIEGKRELGLTTRQRALLSSKDVSVSGASVVEFPNGLPPAPPRKQKEKLSAVEQQLKKAEAAERRRIQVEKAARESEAEAIKKILGQDSSRKKREDKMKQRREEIAQEKDANALKLAPNTIRLVIGSTGTVVTFPNEMGLPSIFEPKSHSYPPPRERCAGPSCANPYKYRDSKSKLPLCSLQCYKAIHEKMQAEATS
ncbi:hypothetical protein RHSIM_Rhsim13G0004400 [Rhododendron simsii]|uniref:INO80 complex subunit B-like conserved region domain-containing protein n=1 Tax=Rhododendron simsii TaxID=118357 RepID=A0A834G0E1_RHOSS|nr:hypothetical protein RHSIM_Rhsim13G0004400 [Rhododendron simsii]